jgi:zeta-carotene desaturase
MADKRAIRGGHPSVTIVGAGIAGMSAALRLLEAGFDVTVIERTNTVGGKFGAVKVNGTYHEHAYHFLSDWCLNFWEIAACIGLTRNKDFVRRDTIKFLRKEPAKLRPDGEYNFLELKHGGAQLHFWDNVHSGVIPPDDMIVYAYSLLDLVTEGDDDDPDEFEFLNRSSVNGFMRSRPYMTDRAALLHQEALLKAFAVPSYETSVRSYRTFVRYFGRDDGGWILKGDCHTKFWRPFLRKLHSYNRQKGNPRFRLYLNASLEAIEAQYDKSAKHAPRVTRISVSGPEGKHWLDTEHLILAVPHQEVARLVGQNHLLRKRLPDLLELRKLKARQMASLDLYFKKPLPGIPAEHVTLVDDTYFSDKGRSRWDMLANDGDLASRYGLSFVDNYQAWKEQKPPRETWLNVVSADFDELAGLPALVAQKAIIDELACYLHFDRKDIDGSRLYFGLNAEAPLFMNTVGSWQFRPETRTDDPEYEEWWVHTRIDNLYVAGDYCRSKIDLVCLEGAVTTGITAAQAVATRCGRGDEVKKPRVPPEVSAQECEAAKAALAPWLALAIKGKKRTGGGS